MALGATGGKGSSVTTMDSGSEVTVSLSWTAEFAGDATAQAIELIQAKEVLAKNRILV